MSLILRSALGIGRLTFQRAFISRPPCLLRRLGSPREVSKFSLRATSSASAFRTADQSQVEPLVENEPPLRNDNDPRPPPSGIMFGNRESTYYHQFMENSPLYRETIFSSCDLEALRCKVTSDIHDFLQKEDWSSVPTEEMVRAFSLITSHAFQHGMVISNSQFDHICSAIARRCMEFTDNEMLEIGKLHTLWHFPETVHAQNYKLLFQSFDNFCCARYQKEWYASRNMEMILKTADVFFWQRVGSKSHYLRCMIYHLSLKCKESHHLIQIMFYLGLLRSVPESYKFYDLEKKVFSFREDYSIAELAIVVSSLFRTKSRLQYYPLMQELLIKSLKGFSTLDDNLLITVCKGFNLAPTELIPLLALFQKRLLGRIDEFQIDSIVHALWMFALNNIVDEDFAQAVYERAMKNISSLRVKELTRLVTIFTEYTSPNRDLSNFAECVFKELQIPEKSKWFQRKSFIEGAILHRLLSCGVCPTEFLGEYLSSMEKPETSNEALGVDVHLEVFYPDYKGARLNPLIREETFKNRFDSGSTSFVRSCGARGRRSTFNLQSVEFAKDTVLDIVDGKEDHLLIKRLVPSSGYIDVLLHISKDGLYLPIPKQMVASQPWELTRIPIEDLKNEDRFLAINFIASSSEFINKKMRWFQSERLSILKKLGYIPLEVGLEFWVNNADPAFKKTDLLTRIAEVLSNK